MHAASGLLSRSMEVLAFVGRQFISYLKSWTSLSASFAFVQFFLVSERFGRRKCSRSEARCTTYVRSKHQKYSHPEARGYCIQFHVKHCHVSQLTVRLIFLSEFQYLVRCVRTRYRHYQEDDTNVQAIRSSAANCITEGVSRKGM